MENSNCFVCSKPFELESSFQCPRQDAVMCRKYLQDRINLQIDFIVSREVANVSICFKCHPRLEKLLKLHFKLEEIQKQIDEVLDVFCDQLLNSSSHISVFDIESVIKKEKDLINVAYRSESQHINLDTLQTRPKVESLTERPFSPLFDSESAQIRELYEIDQLKTESPTWEFDEFESPESTREEVCYGFPNAKIIPPTKELRIILERLPESDLPRVKNVTPIAAKPRRIIKPYPRRKRSGKSRKSKRKHQRSTPLLIKTAIPPSKQRRRKQALNALKSIETYSIEWNEEDILENTNKSNKHGVQNPPLIEASIEGKPQTPFKCIRCDIVCENYKLWTEHRENHMDEDFESPDYAENEDTPSVECPQCNGKFRSHQSLYEHTKSSHGGLVVCPQCGKKFQTNWKLRKHLASVHSKDSKRFKCDKCGEGFRNTTCLSSHMKNECQIRFKCNACEKEFKTRITWQSHLRSVVHRGEAGRFACPLCEKKFKQHYLLNDHIVTHSNSRPFSCKLCEKSFKTQLMLKRHVQRHDPATRPKHTPAPKKFQCTTCLQRFKSRSHHEEHMRTHTGERPFMCDQCAFTTTTLGLLKGHVKISHAENKYGDEFQCQFCGKRLKNEYTLKVHMKWMHEKSLSCSECGEKFTNKSSLNMHMTSHNLALPFCCTICGARFSVKRDLGRHASHHSEIKIKCPRIGCQKHFPTERKMAVHLGTHSSPTFSCENCKKLFKNKFYVRKHIQLNRCKREILLPPAEVVNLNPDAIGNDGK